VYSYNFGTSTVTNLNPPQNSSVTPKSWLGYAEPNVWFTHNGFTTIYKQQSGIDGYASSTGTALIPDPGFCVLNNGAWLISRAQNTANPTQRVLVQSPAGFSGPYLYRGKLPSGRYGSGGMIKTTSNKLIIITTDSSNSSYWITQYPWSIFSSLDPLIAEVEINLTNIITNPRGLFVISNEIYIATSIGEIYHIQKTSPYTVTYITSIGRTVNGIAQNYTNWTAQFT
jgi:hypothetical protein